MTMEPGAIVPELLTLAGAVAALVWGLFLPRGRQWRATAVCALALACAIAVSVAQLHRPAQPVFSGTYQVDAATGVARIVILGAALGVLALCHEAFRRHEREAEVGMLVLLASLGAVLLAGATDLMLVVVAYLLSSAPGYALAGWRKDAPGVEAAMKYFLVGALFGAVMLYGFAWLYGAGGATAYAEHAVSPALAPAAAVGGLAGLAGLLFKLGAVPGHFWVPDVAEGSSTPIAALLTTVPKVGALFAAARLFPAIVPEAAVDWRLVIALVAAASMTLGNLAALWQDHPRRLLGYSTVSQVGYLLMAVVAAGRSGLALPGLAYYVAAYALGNLGAFAIVAELPSARTLEDYGGLSRRHPALSLALVACLLSLIGVPPLGGFVGKLVVFTAAWDAGYAWLTVVAALNTVVSVFYYVRWIAPCYVGAPAASPHVLQSAGWWVRALAYACALGTLALGLLGEPLLGLRA